MFRQGIRRLLHLGKTPIMRRVIASIILMGAAIARPIWLASEGRAFWIDLVSGVFISAMALVLLHVRWRKKETNDMSEDTIRDTFS
ncbi:MAG: hypothetical protein AAFR64_12215 [Pseudomonadota bacterium]